MKEAGQHVRVAIIEYAPGTMSLGDQEGEASLRGLVSKTPDLIEMKVVQTGVDSSVVITTYESREHAEQAAPQGQAWLKEHAGENVKSLAVYGGEVVMTESGSVA